ncbi:MAG: tetratricopeptide repeat protein [Bacteroidota bacterium]
MVRMFLVFVVSLSCHVVFAQKNNAKLAQHYFRVGEYEKSAQLYKELSQQVGFNEYYFNQYIESLMALDDYEQAGDQIQSTLKKYPGQIPLYVTYGNLLERQSMTVDAEQQYRKAIEMVPADRGLLNNLGNSFMRLTKYDLALEVFEKGNRLLKDPSLFAYNLAEIYRRKNEVEPMIQNYLNSHLATSERMSSVQNYFAKYLSGDASYEVLRKQLYAKVQEQPDNIFYPEMIQWVFVTRKKYDRALRQARALDRRLQENGSRIYSIAQIASNGRDYDTAIKAYQYILEEKDATSSYYVDSKRELLEAKRMKLVRSGDYTQEELAQLRTEYIAFLDEMGRGKNTAFMMLELAQLEGLYLNDLPQAIETLNTLIDMPGANAYVTANAKLELGDYYLMKGEVWDATLLYSQVDKQFKEDFLGEKARFKNAKLSYFVGDFDWAQEQFDILKRATTKLIANDAIDLSVFIMDNANLDTTYLPMALYSESELLFFQNRIEEGFAKLDSINLLFPNHGLEDDVYFAKAQQYERQKDYDQASILYQKIIDNFGEEIRADNAIYALAQLNEKHFANPEEAMRLYERLFIDYSDSTFSIDARKRFRDLRGDNIQ